MLVKPFSSTFIYSLTFALITIVVFGSATAQSDWKQIVSVEDICQAYPQQMNQMLDQFDLNQPGLEQVKSARKDSALVEACQALLDYYRTGSTAPHLRQSIPTVTEVLRPRLIRFYKMYLSYKM